MKKSEFRSLIREEIKKALAEGTFTFSTDKVLQGKNLTPIVKDANALKSFKSMLPKASETMSMTANNLEGQQVNIHAVPDKRFRDYTLGITQYYVNRYNYRSRDLSAPNVALVTIQGAQDTQRYYAFVDMNALAQDLENLKRM